MGSNAHFGRSIRLLITAWLSICTLILATAFAGSGTGGIAGPGFSPSSGQGQDNIGQPASLSSGSGIGGTGASLPHEGSGIGGTGIVGVITDFGSIWVNGIEVHYSADMTIETPTGTVPSGDLAIGQVVMARVSRDGNQAQAIQLQLLPSVAGPVQQVNDHQILVAGQSVQLTPQMNIPAVGDWIAVFGLPRANGLLQATGVLPYSDNQPVTVFGLVRKAETAGADVAIQQLPITLSAHQAAPPVGTRILVVGRLSGEHLVAAKVTVDPVAQFAATGGNVRVQGFVDTVTDGTLSIGGLTFNRQALSSDIQAGQLVIIDAYRRPDGVWVADGIESGANLPEAMKAIPRVTPPPDSEAGGHDDDHGQGGSDADNANASEGYSSTLEDASTLEHKVPNHPISEPPDNSASHTESYKVRLPEIETTLDVEAPEIDVPEIQVPEIEAPELEYSPY